MGDEGNDSQVPGNDFPVPGKILPGNEGKDIGEESRTVASMVWGMKARVDDFPVPRI